MFLISWNVAGFSTTLDRINDSYRPTANSDAGNNDAKKNHDSVGVKRKRSPSDALLEYMNRHEVDIFCLQEHKIPISQLSTRKEPLLCSTVEGYESFWSCCVDKKQRGMNGVVTYVRKGLVNSANARPLGTDELDDQGRCVMTDHGSFVVFNVYVPCSGGHSLRSKMKFLHALRRAMNYQRTKHNKAVLLVGDLNIKHSKLDLFWNDRVIHVEDILREVATQNADGNNCGRAFSKWKYDLAKAWPKIVTALESKEVVSTQTTNSLTGAKYGKYRLAVKVDGQRVFLGCHETSPEFCTWRYDFESWTYICPNTESEFLAAEDNVISFSVLAELVSKIGGVHWDEMTQRRIVEESAGVSRVSPTREWLHSVINEDSMVDAFRYFYPNAQGRFTCWNQNTNRRYYNEGARIDYTLVDSTLTQFLERGTDALRCGGSPREQDLDPASEAAALCAATANGRFRPVSFEGGGIIEASQEALDTQFGKQHTGMIYTPPSFSDHIAISLLLNDSCCARDLVLDDRDLPTRKSQPHKSQTTLSSFFGAAPAANGGSNKKSKSASSNTTISSKKKRGIQKFFQGQSGGLAKTNQVSSGLSGSNISAPTSMARKKISTNRKNGQSRLDQFCIKK